MSEGGQNPKIIVSYRRTDSAMAGRIFDRLVQRFGKKSLFIDIDNIPFGGDFRKHIDDALKSSDLLIALVGPKWLGEREGGKVRIMQDADPVRVEIETALKREVPVLPVLLDDARMPEPSELPESIRDFAYRNAADVESGRDFDVHVDRVIKAVEQILGAKAAPSAASSASQSATLVSPAPVAPPGTKRFPMPLILGGALLALAGLAAVFWFARDRISTAEEIDPATGTAYCLDLKRVMGEARSNFVSILGRQTNPSGIWISRVQLPGWDNCLIADWTTEGKIIRYIGCEVPSVATVEALHAKRDSAVSYLRSCLGRDWVSRRVPYQNGGGEVNFELGPDDPVARIRETIYTDGRGNILRIEVDAPSSLAKPAPSETAPETTTPDTSDQPTTTTKAAYCENLKRGVTEARTNFDSILGPTSTSSWPSRIQFQGWGECRIIDFDGESGRKRYLYCYQTTRIATFEDLRAQRDVVVAEVDSCLGPDWTQRRSEFSDKTTDTIFFMGTEDPLVRIRESYYEDKKDWSLQLEIEAPRSATKQPDPSPPKTDQPVPAPAPDTAPNQPPPPPPPPSTD